MMSTLNEYVKYLKDSKLWGKLLSDKEIRYSDFISLFMEMYEVNLLDNNLHLSQYEFKISREKRHTDLWIDKKTKYKMSIQMKKLTDSEEENIEQSIDYDKDETIDEEYVFEPYILIENKFKSLPFQEQLSGYSQKFVNEFINSIKKQVKTIKEQKKDEQSKAKKKELDEEIATLMKNYNNVNNLKFYLLVPFGSYDEKTLKVDVKFKMPYKKTECKTITWVCLTYETIGDKMLEILKVKDKDKGKDYFDELFFDFAYVLKSLSIFNIEMEEKDEEDKILDFFNPKKNSVFNEFENMHDFYQKYRACQCAKKLKDIIGKGSNISNWSFEKFKEIAKEDKTSKENHYIINYSFTNKTGLFEVATKIADELIFVLQYQDRRLKKAIAIKSGKVEYFKDWLCEKWDNRVFSKNTKGKFSEYAMKNGYKFYYSTYKIENDSISDIISFMKKYIMDVDVKDRLRNCYNKYHK